MCVKRNDVVIGHLPGKSGKFIKIIFYFLGKDQLSRLEVIASFGKAVKGWSHAHKIFFTLGVRCS